MNLRCRGIIRFCMLCALISLLAIFIFLIHCPNVPMAGVTSPYHPPLNPPYQDQDPPSYTLPTHRAELTCQVCLDIFTDPVSLTCGHSFCRECVASSPEQKCPSCQGVYAADLTTNLTLKKLADTLKDDIKKEGSSLMCPEHEEKLKLFCETDQELVCVICRDGAKHDRHKFKPIKEAAQTRRKVQEDTMQLLIGQNRTTEDLIKRQESEKTKLKKKSQQLKIQISCQFDEMQQFLKTRQKEIQEALEAMNKEALEEMEANLERLKTHLSEGREKEKQMRSHGDVSEPEAFLKLWTENMKEQKPTAAEMTLVAECLCFSPYSSHLQILVWKEMLQVIKPLPDRLRMKPSSQHLTVSGDGRSIYRKHNLPQQVPYDYQFGQPRRGFAFSSQARSTRFDSGQPDCAVSDPFPGGQHYWEVEVGLGAVWEVGVMHNNLITALRYDGQQYLIKQDNRKAIPTAPVKDAPRKIGVYLDCEASKLLFYNADNSKLIHAVKGVMKNPAPYCAVGDDSVSPDPLKICWY